MRYVVKPRELVHRYSVENKTIVSDFILQNKDKNIWSLLQLNIVKQLRLLAYKLLDHFEDLTIVKEKIDAGVSFENVNTGSLFNDVRGLIANYYQETGDEPKVVFIGCLEYRNMTKEIMLDQEFSFYRYEFSGHQDPKTILKRFYPKIKICISPWLEGVFIWGGEE